MDKFSQLVEDLTEGKLNLTHVQIAIRTYIRHRTDIPGPIKGLLAGESEGNAGLIYRMFAVITNTIGNMELAYRRGVQAGEENKRG